MVVCSVEGNSYLKCNKELNINPHLKSSAHGHSKVGETILTRILNSPHTHTDILKSVKRILIPIRLQSKNSEVCG